MVTLSNGVVAPDDALVCVDTKELALVVTSDDESLDLESLREGFAALLRQSSTEIDPLDLVEAIIMACGPFPDVRNVLEAAVC